MNDRRHRGGRSYAIPVWNGIFDHYERIGPALWVFLWCIDAVTKEKDGVGLVHGGAPVKLSRILADLKGADRESTRRHLEKLVDAGYLRTRRTPYGQMIEVLNSKKFNIWRKEKPQKAVSQPPEEKPQKAVSPPKEKPLFEVEKPQIAVYKEDSAKRHRTGDFDVPPHSPISSSSSLPKSGDDDEKSTPEIAPKSEPQIHTNGNDNGKKSKIPAGERDHLTRIRDQAFRAIAKEYPEETAETIDAVLYAILIRRKSNPATANYLVQSFRREAEDCQLKGVKLEGWINIVRLHRGVEERALIALCGADGTSRQPCKICGSQHKSRESTLKCGRRYMEHLNEANRGTMPSGALG